MDDKQWLAPTIPIAQAQFSEEPHIQACSLIAGDQSGLAMPKLVEKRWGHEIIYKNDSDYCMKLIHIKKDCQTSMHFHVDKHETLLVTAGVLLLKYQDRVGKKFEILLKPNTAWIVSPGFAHQLVAHEDDVTLVEASTLDTPDDSVRIHL